MTDVFPIVPAQGRTLMVLSVVVPVIIGAILIGLLLLLISTTRGSRASSFEVSAEGLRLRGDLWGRLIPTSAIRGGGARLVNLADARDLQPSWRMGGTAVPGYESGWFRLKNGERSLLYLTDRTRAVYVPTTLGYSLLLSPQEPERFVASVKAIAPAP